MKTPIESLAHLAHSKLAVGEVVVLFYLGYPLTHNSREFPQHDCRGRVTKIGRKYLHVSSTGRDVRVQIDGAGWIAALPVTAAKKYWLAQFTKTRAHRTIAFVRSCVEAL